ncbi:hypothetical protein NMY22_g6098 [Coprinellus aureogranulatus]|nr:hypothetical protein NMY22_g6098 [Coprinellus aureogranulatus]
MRVRGRKWLVASLKASASQAAGPQAPGNSHRDFEIGSPAGRKFPLHRHRRTFSSVKAPKTIDEMVREEEGAGCCKCSIM